jgi:hypothetical protein
VSSVDLLDRGQITVSQFTVKGRVPAEGTLAVNPSDPIEAFRDVRNSGG